MARTKTDMPRAAACVQRTVGRASGQRLPGRCGHAHAGFAQNDDIARLNPDPSRAGRHVDEATAAQDAGAVLAPIVADPMMAR